MKNKFSFFSVILIFTAVIFSCSLNENEGVLLVKNNSGDTSIKNVMIKSETDSGFHSVYSGEIKADDSFYISVPEGEYCAKIETEKTLLNGESETKTFETGYNDYKKIDRENTQTIIFDGNGIFFQK